LRGSGSGLNRSGLCRIQFRGVEILARNDPELRHSGNHPRERPVPPWHGLVGCEAFAIDANVIEADTNHNRKVDGKLTTWPEEEKVTRPVREYMAAPDQAMEAEAERIAAKSDDEPPGNHPSEPKVTLLTAPIAAWTSKGRMKVAFAFGINYLIDAAAAIIVDVAATPARWSAEVAATKLVP
jgi:hypothetical protein